MAEKSDTKTCIQCGCTIPEIARKCPECSSYLDWRNVLTWLGPSLSIAAVGVGLLLSLNEISKLVEDAVQQPRSAVQIFDAKLVDGGIEVSLLNRGDAIAILDRSLQCVEQTTSSTPFTLRIVGSANNFLGPNENRTSRWDVWNAYVENGKDDIQSESDLAQLDQVITNLWISIRMRRILTQRRDRLSMND